MASSSLLIWVLLVVVVGVCLTGAQCADSGDRSTVYVPGALAPSFSVNTTRKGGVSFKHTLRSGGQPITPFVLAQFDLSDPFLAFMVRNNDSIHDLLTLTPQPNTQFVLAASKQDDLRLIESRMNAALRKLPQHVQGYWRERLFFASAPLNHTATAIAMQRVLSQWPYLRRELTVVTSRTSITVPRLDGHFQFCNIVAWSNHSPAKPTQPYPASPAAMAVVHDPCLTVLPDLRGKWAFVTPQRNASCSVEDMARRVVAHANATAIIIMAAEGEPLVQIGQNAFEQEGGVWAGNDNQGFCSMVAYDHKLLHLITSHSSSSAQAHGSHASNPQATMLTAPTQAEPSTTTTTTTTATSTPVAASSALVQFTTHHASSSPFVGVDSDGRLREVGATLNPALTILGYAAQGLDYKARLGVKLREPNLLIPLLRGVVGKQSTQTAPIPPASVLSPFASLFLEARMTCRGTFDLDCDKWDHVHTVAMVCDNGSGDDGNLEEANVSPHEIGRWVTPYRRRVGHWLTPATRLLATLDGASACNVTLRATDNGSPWAFSLNARLFDAGEQSGWLEGDGGGVVLKAAARSGLADSRAGPIRDCSKAENAHDSRGCRRQKQQQQQHHHHHKRSGQQKQQEAVRATAARPILDIPLFNSTVRATFDGMYNNRTPITVSPRRGFSSATIEAIISGHGAMEFVASRHVFTVNDHAHSVSFMDPLDQNGCAKHVWQGVEPNGHGAFEFGRDGWCNGWHVPPVVFNVTADVLPSSSNSAGRRTDSKITIGYRAYQYNAAASKWTEPHSPNGEMRLSSRIVFWS